MTTDAKTITLQTEHTAPSLSAIRAYLGRQGWTASELAHEYTAYARLKGNASQPVILPTNESMVDHTSLLHTLSRYEGRTASAVLRDIAACEEPHAQSFATRMFVDSKTWESDLELARAEGHAAGREYERKVSRECIEAHLEDCGSSTAKEALETVLRCTDDEHAKIHAADTHVTDLYARGHAAGVAEERARVVAWLRGTVGQNNFALSFSSVDDLINRIERAEHAKPEGGEVMTEAEADAACDRVMSMTDQEVLAEALRDGVDVEATRKHVQEVMLRAAREVMGGGVKGRLAVEGAPAPPKERDETCTVRDLVPDGTDYECIAVPAIPIDPEAEKLVDRLVRESMSKATTKRILRKEPAPKPETRERETLGRYVEIGGRFLRPLSGHQFELTPRREEAFLFTRDARIVRVTRRKRTEGR